MDEIRIRIRGTGSPSPLHLLELRMPTAPADDTVSALRCACSVPLTRPPTAHPRSDHCHCDTRRSQTPPPRTSHPGPHAPDAPQMPVLAPVRRRNQNIPASTSGQGRRVRDEDGPVPVRIKPNRALSVARRVCQMSPPSSDSASMLSGANCSSWYEPVNRVPERRAVGELAVLGLRGADRIVARLARGEQEGVPAAVHHDVFGVREGCHGGEDGAG